MDTIGIDASALLREARARSGMSQRALAQRAGTSQSVIARIELGRTNPTVATLERLLLATGHTIDTRLRVTAREIRDRAVAYFRESAPPGIVAAWMHGSTARDARHRESDVDIAVLFDPAEISEPAARSDLRVRIGADLVAALGIDDVDIVVLDDAPPGLAVRIVLDGEALIAHDEERVHAFRRDAQLRLADLQPFLRRMRRIKRMALAR